MELCKIRFDGCHHLVSPYRNKSDFETKDLILKSPKELGLKDDVNKKKFFVNDWALAHYPYTNKGRKPIKEEYRKIHTALKQMYILMYSQGIKEEKMIEDMFDTITTDYDFIEYYGLEEQDIWVHDYIEKFVKREKENLKGRKGTFRRKALNNDWNYFVTFTYDDSKHNEESYVKKLKKKLQNLHTNYGWLYMGCFERSKTGRLHFHGLIYVPENKMRGVIREESYYDTNSHKKAVSFINEDFEKKIGRNDFKPITKFDITFSNALEYIIKYIGKSENKLVYSRGIKDDYFALMNFEENVICKISDETPYYVCADSPKIELTKELKLANVLLNDE